MVIEVTAATAVKILAPFLVKGGVQMVQGMSQPVFEKVKQVYETISRKWNGDPLKSQILSRLEEEPKDSNRHLALQAFLIEEMNNDSNLLQLVRSLVETAQSPGDSSVEASGDAAIAIGGNVVGSHVESHYTDRSVKAGNITNSNVVTGDGNTLTTQVTASGIDPSKVDIQAEILALREILGNLESPHQTKINNALEEAREEADKETPDKDEVGKALQRGIDYASKATTFATAIEKLKPHLAPAAAWLGENWDHILSYINPAA